MVKDQYYYLLYLNIKHNTNIGGKFDSNGHRSTLFVTKFDYTALKHWTPLVNCKDHYPHLVYSNIMPNECVTIWTHLVIGVAKE